MMETSMPVPTILGCEVVEDDEVEEAMGGAAVSEMLGRWVASDRAVAEEKLRVDVEDERGIPPCQY